MKVLSAHARDDVVASSMILSDIRDDLEQVVLWCLEKNRSDRFEDAESLWAAFARCELNGLWNEYQAKHWWDESSQPLPDIVSGGTLEWAAELSPEKRYLRSHE